MVDEHVDIQRKNKAATEDMTRRIQDKLRRFRAKHADCLPLDPEDPSKGCQTTLTVDSTLARLKERAMEERSSREPREVPTTGQFPAVSSALMEP